MAALLAVTQERTGHIREEREPLLVLPEEMEARHSRMSRGERALPQHARSGGARTAEQASTSSRQGAARAGEGAAGVAPRPVVRVQAALLTVDS